MTVDGPRARLPVRARVLRLVLLALVVIALGPGTFLRTPTGTRSDRAVVTVTPVAERSGISGELEITGAWELTAPHGWFGGFSALVAKGSTGLIAGTDRGFLLDLDVSGEAPRAVPDSFRFVGISTRGRKEFVDLEALARDPASGTLWAAFENDNLVMRFAADGTRRIHAPPAIARWGKNSGPETMERLADGRFLILSEGTESGGALDRPALLYPGDPVAGAAPLRFRFNCRAAYSPVDATEVPGGRVLILMRYVRYTIPAEFDAVIMIADPATIRADGQWRGEVIQRLQGPVFGENFEGIAYVPDPSDPAKGSIWLIADDNFSVFQRSLLLRFAWNEPGDALQRRAAVRARDEWERALNGVQSPLLICPPIDASGKAIPARPARQKVRPQPAP
ncbi:MAG: hypothetical protein EAY70_07175 [Sphingomonadales bacterium]|nr:MAG: hypothetical protein EAY70_07175 [Sphingomonadales bacterium]